MRRTLKPVSTGPGAPTPAIRRCVSGAASLHAALRLAAEEQARHRLTDEPSPDVGRGEFVRAAVTAAVRGLPAFAPAGPPGTAGGEAAGGTAPGPADRPDGA